MSFDRFMPGPAGSSTGNLARRDVPRHEERRQAPRDRLGTGSLACPTCDVPVALSGAGVSPAELLRCPFCGHAGPVRQFLSLAQPTRPARVVVRVS
jgi:hypothetical protein